MKERTPIFIYPGLISVHEQTPVLGIYSFLIISSVWYQSGSESPFSSSPRVGGVEVSRAGQGSKPRPRPWLAALVSKAKI